VFHAADLGVRRIDGVEDGRQRQLLGPPREQLLDLLPLRDVTCRRRDLDAGLGQLRRERLHSARIRAGAPGKEDVRRPAAGKPASNLATQRTVAPRDKHRPAWLPGAAHRPIADRSMSESSYVQAAVAHRELVLVTGPPEDSAEMLERRLVDLRGQIDEPAPPLWLSPTKGSAEAPPLRP